MPTFSPNTPINDHAGEPILGDDQQPLTLRGVIVQALTTELPGDVDKPYGERIALHQLAARVSSQDPVTTDGAAMVAVLSRLSRYATTTVIGRVHEAMDNSPDLQAAEAVAQANQDAIAAQAKAKRDAKAARERARAASKAAKGSA